MKDAISFFLLVWGQGRLAWHQGHICTSTAPCNEGFRTLDILAACFMGTIAGCITEQFITAEALLIAQCPQCTHKDGWIIKGCKKNLLEVSLPHTRVQQEVHSGGLCVTHSRDCQLLFLLPVPYYLFYVDTVSALKEIIYFSHGINKMTCILQGE